jgi:hypothetical protein
MRLQSEPETSPERAEQVARIMRGAWRTTPPPPDFSENDLDATKELLDRGGLNGLAWWRIRGSPLALSGAGKRLRGEYVTQSVRAAVASHRVLTYVSALEAEHIPSIVFKGWTLFPYYAEPGLRPAGDVDLAVAPEQARRAVQILRALGAGPVERDVHAGLADRAHSAFIPERTWNDLLERSVVRELGPTTVRVLSPEDELQLLCIHFIRHLAARPIWLTDIAAAVEHRPAVFDWARLASTPPYASWIASAILLAHALVGANLEGTPFATRTDELPSWLVGDVLKRWSTKPVPSIMVNDSILVLWNKPSRWGEAARTRLPNRLAAIMRYDGGLDERFLARYQARWLWEMVTEFGRRNMQTGEEAEIEVKEREEDIF